MAAGSRHARHDQQPSAAAINALAGSAVPRSAVMERGLDGIEQRTNAERHIVDAPVHEEAGRAAHAALEPAVDMLTHPLQVNVIVHLPGIARHVEPDLFRITVQLLWLQMLLVCEQQLVHLPELALTPRAFRGLGCKQRVGMNVYKRKVAVREPHTLFESLEQQLYGRSGLLAVRTLEVPVLHESDGRMFGPEGVVDLGNGRGQVKVGSLIHRLPVRVCGM